ncbi:hypothetical protein ES288_A11G279000v1 [Gossypium darwinii]|uniref:Uncharacterized protein n=1 Tax=Gossypium darwinii TaxID=34276 RepID=A0A5D2EPK5_GOSDA|nr:hypothetical protein ES288_A11G279000v1 [Gossypium darwinii]
MWICISNLNKAFDRSVEFQKKPSSCITNVSNARNLTKSLITPFTSSLSSFLIIFNNLYLDLPSAASLLVVFSDSLINFFCSILFLITVFLLLSVVVSFAFCVFQIIIVKLLSF